MSTSTRTPRVRAGLTGLAGVVLIVSGCAGTAEREAWNRYDEAVASVPARTAPPEENPATLQLEPSLSTYTAMALERNPGLRAARAEWRAALEMAPQLRALPDPMITYSTMLEPMQTLMGVQQRRLGVSQAFPWFGSLGARSEVAVSEAEAARRRYEDALQKTSREVVTAYAEYYYLGAALRTTRENRTLLEGWEAILRGRYAAGQVTYSNLIQVQVELGRMDDQIITLERQQEPSAARLRTLMDLHPDTALPWPDRLPEPGTLESRETLLANLEAGNAELKVLDAMADRETRRLEVARKESFPNFMVGMEWTPMGKGAAEHQTGKDQWMAMIGIEVPIWTGKRSAARREAVAMREAVLDRKADMSNMLRESLDMAVFRYDDSRRKVSLYRDSLIPKGQQSLEASFAAFESGKGDFLSVLDAQRSLLEFSLLMDRASADLVQARAAIDLLTGQARVWSE